MFHEYPKAVYKGGDESLEWRIVNGAEAEKLAEDDGFSVIGTKIEIVPDTVPLIDALRAEAESLGVEVDRRWGEKRLAEEISKTRA